MGEEEWDKYNWKKEVNNDVRQMNIIEERENEREEKEEKRKRLQLEEKREKWRGTNEH